MDKIFGKRENHQRALNKQATSGLSFDDEDTGWFQKSSSRDKNVKFTSLKCNVFQCFDKTALSASPKKTTFPCILSDRLTPHALKSCQPPWWNRILSSKQIHRETKLQRPVRAPWRMASKMLLSMVISVLYPTQRRKI